MPADSREVTAGDEEAEDGTADLAPLPAGTEVRMDAAELAALLRGVAPEPRLPVPLHHTGSSTPPRRGLPVLVVPHRLS